MYSMKQGPLAISRACFPLIGWHQLMLVDTDSVPYLSGEVLVFFSTQKCVYVSWNTHLWKWNCYFKTYFNPICVLALVGPVQRNANSFFALGKTIKMVRAHYFQNIILFEVRVRRRLNFLCQKEIAPVGILF